MARRKPSSPSSPNTVSSGHTSSRTRSRIQSSCAWKSGSVEKSQAIRRIIAPWAGCLVTASAWRWPPGPVAGGQDDGHGEASQAAVNLLLAGACATIVAGSLLQAATGFGFSLLAAPLTFAAIDPAPAAGGLLLLLGAEVHLLTLAEGRRPQPLRHSTVTMLAWAAPGALAGVAVLRALPAVALQVAVTLGVLGTLAARRAAGRRAHVPAWAAGLAAGALTTSTTTNGPPMLLHLVGQGAPPAAVRDTLSVCFLGLAVLGALALWATGTPALPGAALVLGLIPGVAAGHLAGRRVFSRLAAGGAYEGVLTTILVIAAVAGLAGVVL